MTASMYMTVVIAFERYLAVRSPFKYHHGQVSKTELDLWALVQLKEETRHFCTMCTFIQLGKNIGYQLFQYIYMDQLNVNLQGMKDNNDWFRLLKYVVVVVFLSVVVNLTKFFEAELGEVEDHSQTVKKLR